MLYRLLGKVLILERQIGDDKNVLKRTVEEIRSHFRGHVARVKYEPVPPMGRPGVRVTFWSRSKADEVEVWLEENLEP